MGNRVSTTINEEKAASASDVKQAEVLANAKKKIAASKLSAASKETAEESQAEAELLRTKAAAQSAERKAQVSSQATAGDSAALNNEIKSETKVEMDLASDKVTAQDAAQRVSTLETQQGTSRTLGIEKSKARGEAVQQQLDDKAKAIQAATVALRGAAERKDKSAALLGLARQKLNEVKSLTNTAGDTEVLNSAKLQASEQEKQMAASVAAAGGDGGMTSAAAAEEKATQLTAQINADEQTLASKNAEAKKDIAEAQTAQHKAAQMEKLRQTKQDAADEESSDLIAGDQKKLAGLEGTMGDLEKKNARDEVKSQGLVDDIKRSEEKVMELKAQEKVREASEKKCLNGDCDDEENDEIKKEKAAIAGQKKAILMKETHVTEIRAHLKKEVLKGAKLNAQETKEERKVTDTEAE